MNTTTTEKLIARRVRLGYNEAESRTRLAELVATAGKSLLNYALCYEGFATSAQADKITEGI